MLIKFTSTDEALEAAAGAVEGHDIYDCLAPRSRRKRDREDNDLRTRVRQELRVEMAERIRRLKTRRDLDPIEILRIISEAPEKQHVLHLMDAWPLKWKGWLDIFCLLGCTSNWIPPETEYRIRLTDKGRAVLADAPPAEDRGGG